MNARSLKTVNRSCNILVQLQNLVDNSDSNVIPITETWLNENVSNCENENYTVYRRDRCNKRGWGILLAIKNTHESRLIRNITSHLIITVSVKGVNTSVLFVLCHRPPSADTISFVSAVRNLLLSEYSNLKTFVC